MADQPGVGIGLFLAREIIQAQKVYKSDIKERKGFYIFCVSSDSKEWNSIKTVIFQKPDGDIVMIKVCIVKINTGFFDGRMA